jgi:hypothetical protein
MTTICFGLSVVWLVNLSAATAQSQTLAPDRPEFEAASIKRRPVAPGPIRVSAGVDASGIQYRSVTVMDCIRNAYGVPRYRISGGPDWLGSDRYDIIARASSAAPKAQLMLMLQTLLADRFKLRTHLETRDLPRFRSRYLCRFAGTRLETGIAEESLRSSGHRSRRETLRELKDELHGRETRRR